jgi:hypothetical protein
VIATLIFCWFILVSVISGTPSATMAAIVLCPGALLRPLRQPAAAPHRPDRVHLDRAVQRKAGCRRR